MYVSCLSHPVCGFFVRANQADYDTTGPVTGTGKSKNRREILCPCEAFRIGINHTYDILAVQVAKMKSIGSHKNRGIDRGLDLLMLGKLF